MLSHTPAARCSKAACKQTSLHKYQMLIFVQPFLNREQFQIVFVPLQAALCLAQLPQISGDVEVWAATGQEALATAHAVLDVAYQGLEDAVLVASCRQDSRLSYLGSGKGEFADLAGEQSLRSSFRLKMVTQLLCVHANRRPRLMHAADSRLHSNIASCAGRQSAPPRSLWRPPRSLPPARRQKP